MTKFAIVPVEATEEMKVAGKIVLPHFELRHGTHSVCAADKWSEMLSAAPPVPDELVERVAFYTYPKDERGHYEKGVFQ